MEGINCVNGNQYLQMSLGMNTTYIRQQIEDKFVTQGASKN
jgi:hypothetical protein